MKTSYYSRFNKIDASQFVPVAISGDEGRIVGFTGKSMRNLSPTHFLKNGRKKRTQSI